ncbi:MAG: hypothetical protein RIS64_4152 [Bacteroidota bacterium]|jgi:hypothetical protein
MLKPFDSTAASLQFLNIASDTLLKIVKTIFQEDRVIPAAEFRKRCMQIGTSTGLQPQLAFAVNIIIDHAIKHEIMERKADSFVLHLCADPSCNICKTTS